MPEPGPLSEHELNEPHEFGDANLFIANGDALAVARTRFFTAKNKTSLPVVHRGMSEFLLEGSFLSVSRSGFKRFETVLNDVAREFPELKEFGPLSGWEARFGRSWAGITLAEDLKLKAEVRRAFSEPAKGRVLDLRQRRNGLPITDVLEGRTNGGQR